MLASRLSFLSLVCRRGSNAAHRSRPPYPLFLPSFSSTTFSLHHRTHSTTTNSNSTSSVAAHSRPFRIALIGRPNVGKSTLFNRLTGNSKGQWTGGSALVTPIPGTTRDRKTGPCSFGGLSMIVTDTGGLVEEDELGMDEAEEKVEEEDEDDPRGLKRQRAREQRKLLQDLINAQVAQAVQESDAVLFVLDTRGGVGPEEAHLARWLHRMGAQDKTLLVANKAEGGVLSSEMQAAIYDAYEFGLGDPVAVSAAHNEGVSDLASVLVERAKGLGFEGSSRSSSSCSSSSSSGNNQGGSRSSSISSSGNNGRGGKEGKKGNGREMEDNDGREGEGEEEEEEEKEEEEGKDDVITVAFVGLPNVGKSSLVNATLNKRPRPHVSHHRHPEDDDEERNLDQAAAYPRLITSSIAGTTRDVVLVDYSYQNRRLRLVDTAGIRKTGRQDHSNVLEHLSVTEALRAVRYANVVVLVLDGQQLRLRRQEQVVASRAFKEGRALVVAANKSDLLLTSPRLFAENVREQLKLLSPQLGSLPVVATSALNGQGVSSLLPAILRAYQAWNTRVSTGLLNRWLLETQRLRSPPLTATTRKTIKLKYMAQVKTRPPTFALVTNRAEVEESYVRFLRNRLQDDFGLHGMDVRLLIKSTGGENNPYAAKAAQEAAERRRALVNQRRKKRAEREGGGRGAGNNEEEEEREEEERKKRRQVREATKRLKVEAQNKRRAFKTRTVGSFQQ